MSLQSSSDNEQPAESPVTTLPSSLSSFLLVILFPSAATFLLRTYPPNSSYVQRTEQHTLPHISSIDMHACTRMLRVRIHACRYAYIGKYVRVCLHVYVGSQSVVPLPSKARADVVSLLLSVSPVSPCTEAWHSSFLDFFFPLSLSLSAFHRGPVGPRGCWRMWTFLYVIRLGRAPPSLIFWLFESREFLLLLLKGISSQGSWSPFSFPSSLACHLLPSFLLLSFFLLLGLSWSPLFLLSFSSSQC